ncbi:MAG: Rieske 2Fe-2S domain-containing protein [Xenococcaceae cyanobacterium MO_167.B27]|nr:Rieske 2Fe-2S domain-containing protein [Xenococcaceae cyanobacterium MO_167.B27]
MTINTIEDRELLVAGGDDPTKFDPAEAWYPVHYLEDLDKARPTKFTLLEMDIVIWWDSNEQTWRAFRDQCPHRLAPLSEGRINEQGHIECPYHGWGFEGNGNCKYIPQQAAEGKAETAKRACVQSFSTAEAQGLLFVYAGNPQNSSCVELPLVDVLQESDSDWVCLNTFRDIPYDALTLLENVLDVSHIPYTHHNTVGDRSNAAPVELKVTDSGKWGFKGIWEEGPRKGALGTQYTTFTAPCLMWHDLTSKQFGRTLTVVYATPIRKGECRLFARFPFKFSSPIPAFFIKLSPRWYSHISQNAILEDDQIFLHYQERYLESNGGSFNYNQACYLPSKADLYVSELHQWVNLYHSDPFPNSPLPASPLTEKLLERYHSHTKKCSSCRQALKRVKQIKVVLAAIAIIGWTISPVIALWLGKSAIWTTGGFSGIALIAAVVWCKLAQLERKFYQGREIPPRNFLNI